jgi:hypothetical protein
VDVDPADGEITENALASSRCDNRITGYPREQGQRHAVSQYLSLLTSRADIQGIDLLGGTRR